jgi:hypothetical protein
LPWAPAWLLHLLICSIFHFSSAQLLHLLIRIICHFHGLIFIFLSARLLICSFRRTRLLPCSVWHRHLGWQPFRNGTFFAIRRPPRANQHKQTRPCVPAFVTACFFVAFRKPIGAALLESKHSMKRGRAIASQMSSIGLVGFALVLALVQLAVLAVVEDNVQRGSAVYESGHIVVLAWAVSNRDIEVIWKVLSQVCVMRVPARRVSVPQRCLILVHDALGWLFLGGGGKRKRSSRLSGMFFSTWVFVF